MLPTDPPARRGPSWWHGALVGALCGAAATAVFALGAAAASVPFPPFIAFDGVNRLLPGRVLSFGIERLVALIRDAHLGPTASTAKFVEQSMGVALALVAFAVAGVLLFVLARHRRARFRVVAVGAALAAGGGLAWLAVSLGRTDPAGAWIATLWFALVLAGWGLAVATTATALGPTRDGAPAPPSPPSPPSDRGGSAAAGEGRVVVLPDRRRVLLALGGTTAAITGLGAAGTWILRDRARAGRAPGEGAAGWWSDAHALPNAGAPVSPVPGTRPEFTRVPDHYRIDINSMPPRVDADAWRLRITGLVDRPASLSLDALRGRFDPVHQFITLACISNPIPGDLIGTTRWTGVRLRDVLDDAGLGASGTHLRIRAADGFDEVVAIEEVRDDPRIVLAYAWDGRPLEAAHGFPLRLYLPDRFGMKQPKWIESLEAIDHWEPGYWVRRGWDAAARMRARSIIDVVATDLAHPVAEGPPLVPMGGIAHAGARGISRVEVRVDDEPWRPAEIREPLSSLTWVIWRHEAPIGPGDHRVTVRCVDGDGTPQITREAPPHPSGATGLHVVAVSG